MKIKLPVIAEANNDTGFNVAGEEIILFIKREMKKLLTAVIIPVVMVSSVQAKPSVEDGLSIKKFCDQIGKDVSNIYVLKEQGFEKKYVIDAVVSEGGSKDYAKFSADSAYELKSGMNKSYVHIGMTKACVKTMTAEVVEE